MDMLSVQLQTSTNQVPGQSLQQEPQRQRADRRDSEGAEEEPEETGQMPGPW